MRVVVDMDVDWDGQDEESLQATKEAIKDMIQSGAESFNFCVNIHSFQTVVAPQILEDNGFVPSHYTEGFAPLRPTNFVDSCGSCRFFDTKEGKCNERNIFVKFNSPKCPQWRYFG